jgi:hypothetical protein
VGTAKDAIKRAVQGQALGPRSLNIEKRKRENKSIEMENHALAKRLFDKTASLSKKKMDNEFQSHMKFK